MARILLCALCIAIVACPGSGARGPWDAGADAGDAGPIDFIDDAGINTATLAPGWSCSVFTSAGDVWLRTSNAATARFDYRIGAGGALSTIQPSFTIRNYVAPSRSGEVTDRIVQWTVTSNGLTGVVDGGDPRFHVAQGGTDKQVAYPSRYLITPSMSLDHSTSGTSCEIDVFSVPQDQFNPQLQPQLKGKVSALTRYRVFGRGELLIRRTLFIDRALAPRPHDGGVTLDPIYLEAWTPLDRGTFNSLATSIADAGYPLAFWQSDGGRYPSDGGIGVPTNPELDVASTEGYAVAFTYPAWPTSPAVGLVFGRQHPCTYSDQVCTEPPSPVTIPLLDGGTQPVPSYALNATQFDVGIAPLPGLTLRGLDAGTVVDQYLVMVVSRTFDSVFAEDVLGAVDLIPPPRVLVPENHLTPDWDALKTVLIGNLDDGGIRTDQLAGLPP